jgi:hypothetical protein
MNYVEQAAKGCISSVREENKMNAWSDGHVCFPSRLFSETIQWNFDYILLALNYILIVEFSLGYYGLAIAPCFIGRSN